jgi:anti-anti-sigma factor
MRSDPRGQPRHTVPARRNIAPSGLQAVTRQRGESLEVALVGELDMAATFKLESDLERRLAAGDVRRLVLDLERLTFIDSAGLGALLAIRERTQDLGIEMALTNISAPVRRILDLSGLRAALLD